MRVQLEWLDNTTTSLKTNTLELTRTLCRLQRAARGYTNLTQQQDFGLWP